MRLWTLHPKYLDAKGLVALWREALLAQAVLAGRTRGYRHHPQLRRFTRDSRPLASIAVYLRCVHAESLARGYAFDAKKISRSRFDGYITATRGQLEFEWTHLLKKLRLRDPARWSALNSIARPAAHPLFRLRAGPIADWEVQP
jgi:hypothetical protein